MAGLARRLKSVFRHENLVRFQAVYMVLVAVALFSPAFAQNPLQEKVEKVLTALEGAAVALLAIGLIRLGIEWAQGGSATRDNMYSMAFAAAFILGARALATYLN